jgi:hypothetical protein
MSLHKESHKLEDVASVAVQEEDRRLNSRAKFLKPLRIRHADNGIGESVGTMIDLSREGLYFTTQSSEYQVGMLLQMTLPNSGSECSGEVVRIEPLPQGRSGIGVRIFAW